MILPTPAVGAMLLLMVFPLGYTAYLSLHQWYASSVKLARVFSPKHNGIGRLLAHLEALTRGQ